MKPLARWTFGEVTPPGEETLRHSVRRFRIIYPEFDLVVCHNNLTKDQRSRLDSLDVPLYEQSVSDLDYPLVPAGSPPGHKRSMPGWGWKLCPPRLRPEAHELWIDNDLIVRERLPTVDEWLKTDRTLISKGLRREYGDYEDVIPPQHVFCAGFFGLPPGFDFADSIRRHCQLLRGRPLGYYNEQGVTSCAVLERDVMVVPLSEIDVVKKLERPLAKGLHFIGVNRSHRHDEWERYKCCTLM